MRTRDGCRKRVTVMFQLRMALHVHGLQCEPDLNVIRSRESRVLTTEQNTLSD